MDLNFSKKTRKIVASLLAVAILLGVLPVSGLTGNSSGAESSSSENSTKTIYVNSTKQPILFDSVGNFKEIIPKVKKNIYSTEAENGDKIALFTDIGNGNSVVFYKTTEWTPSAYMWKEDSSENPDKNAAWPGEAMKKYGDSNSSLYYYVYKSAKGFDKVIFNDGNDQNGDQTDNKDLKAWNVYTKTSAGRPICDSLTKCDVSDNFNVYEYADSKLSGKNISAPQGMGATIEIADKKYTVCGDGAESKITCYEDDKITSLTANTVDGYTAKVTNSVVGDNQITYSVTYTNKTYGMQFSVENTVTFIKKPRLVLDGKWNVTFDGKPVNDGDTICKQEGIKKELKASFDIEKVTFKGTEITKGYETAITLNDNKFNSSCESSNLKDNNTLVATVSYNGDTSNCEFKFSYVEGNAVLEENDEDSSVYFEGKNIYTNTNKTNANKNEITLKLTKSENVDDVTFSLRKGVSTPDSSNEIKDAVKREGDKVIIDNTKLKLSDIKKATLTLKSEKFGISDDYTLIYDTISKDNFTYSNTNENGRYFVNANTGVTVTFNLVDIDKKLFNDENAEVTCDKENGVKISFNNDNKEWKATITKSADYTFTFSNNGFVQTVKITKQDLYLDDTVPVVNSFKFEDGSSDGDKLLSFLTFGIYHNDKIKVTVTAEDPNEDDAGNEIASSGASSITLYNGENKLETKNVTENQAEFILSSKDGADTAKFNLYATATDNVGNESKYWTFDRVERISHENGREFNNLSSYDEPPTWDNFEVVATKENPEVIIKDEDITAIEGTHKYTDNDKMYFSSGANIKFKVTDEISGINSVKVYLDGDSESGKQLTVTTKSKNDPARYDQLKTKTTSDTFSCNTGDLSEGEHTIRIYAQNNSGNIVDGGCVTKTFYVDKTAPKVTSFKFEDGSSDGDKLLSFLTFGIYHNDKIKVTVTAEDPNEDDAGNEIASSGASSITLYNGENKLETKNVTENQAEFILSSKDGADTAKFNLYATATDNVGNESKYWTFDRVERISHENGREFNNLSSYDEPPTWDNFEVVATKENPEVIIKDEDITAIEGTHKYTDNDKMYFSSGANIKFKVTDEISGINSVKVYLDGDSESGKQLTVTTKSKNDPARYDQLKTKTTSDTFSCNTGDLSEGEHTIRIYAQNNSGNIVDGGCVTKTFYVDKTAPKVTSFKFEDGSSDGDKLLSFLTFGIYHNDKIKVTVTAEDPNEDDAGNEIASSGASSITLYNGENKLETKNVTENQAEFILSSKDGADTAKFNLYATATDNVGNESKYWTFDRVERISHENGREFNNLSSYDEPPTWDNFEVVATKENPEVIIKDEDITAIEGTHKYTDNDKMYFSSGANIKFKVTDEISGINSVKVYLDGDSESGKQLTVTTKSKNDPARYDQLKTKTTSDTFSCNTGDLSEGEHTIRIYAQNNSGNIVDGGCVTKTFYVDKTAPVITSFDIQNNDKQKIVDLTPEKQYYNYYFQTDTQVTVNAKDNGNCSGIKTIYFRAYDVVTGEEYKSSKNVSTDNATASATFTVKANFKGELYAYAVDNVDNNGKTQHGEKKPDDLIVETQQHHNGNASVTMSRAKASYKDNSGLDLYSGNVNARVVFEDAYAGIKDAEIKVSDYTNTVTNTISVSVDNNGNITSSGNGSVTVTGTKAKNTNDNLITNIVVDYVVTDNSNNIKITTSMTDRAGNKTDNVKDSLSIDKTKPVIDVKYDNNEHTTYGGNDYYKADRTATVTVTERNFDESLVEAAIMRNGGRYTTIGGWTHNNNTADPDKSTHVAKIVYNTDGDFTFDIAVKDKAMNSADKFTQQKFTVDKTAPVIDVSFDNNSAKNGNYYKADRTATIKITEHNFNSGSQYVNIPVTAEGATAPSVVGWSGSGDDHNATVSFNKDGKYSFTVDYTDLAGNKAVQKKVDSFYIDKTAPEVEITGVADHQAYNGTVAPVVTYRDDNFTDDHDFKFTKINIDSKVDDTSKFDYDTDGNGVTEFIYKYRDFAEVLENDGIYNFTVELSDKAGNSTSKSVTFSVNRFGSTFKASDESEKLIKNGYTNAEQDIVVEEINVSPLTKHSVTLAKSGGNSTELVENTDYKFTSSNNGNEWCKSVYTVNKKNFSDEAAYTVTIMSVDKAKNTNNNRMADSSLSTEQKNKRECAISFVVDKTSPLVSITGIKDNELYKEASKKVKIVCEDDNLDKSKLVVTLDNKKLAEGEDYTIVDDKDGSIAGMLTAEIVLKAETGGIKENLKVTIGDLAGNTGEKSVDNFILSANIFQRFFANPVLVICTFAGLALVIAAVIFFVAKKRKKAE